MKVHLQFSLVTVLLQFSYVFINQRILKKSVMVFPKTLSSTTIFNIDNPNKKLEIIIKNYELFCHSNDK